MAKLSLILVTLVLIGAAASLRRVCYHTNWAQYRNGPAKFFPENIDPSLCTHIIYSFAKMVGNKLAPFEWNDESTPWMKGMYERFGAIKQQNPSVKLSLAVGGWNMGSAPFTKMVASAAGRQEFASTSVTFLRKHGFDGLDIDWEYPANRGSPPADKHRYTQLLQALRAAFEAETVPAGKEKLLLSAALPAGKDKIDTGYEIPEISGLLDMMNLMSYDLHGSWEDHTGHNSPLYSRSSETGNETYLNIDWAAQYWVQKGAPRAKMNIGMGLYGRSFKLPYGTSDTKMGCPAKGAGAAGLYTREAGFISYYEVCEHLKNGATKMYEAEQKVPYFADGDLWVGYDDQDSLRLKVDYVKQEQFGGVMVWALDLDDFSGSCGEGKFPLMHAIVDEINANSPPGTPPPTTAAPVVTTRAPVVTTRAPAVTTQRPVITNVPVTTRRPIVTTQAPVITTAASTNAPVTAAPQQTTTMPAQATTKVPSNNGQHHLTPVSSTEFDCKVRNDGYYPSPTSCSNYYICAAQITFRTDCHPGLEFNPSTLYCDFPDHVTCSRQSNTNTQQQTAGPIVVTTKQPTQAPWTPAPTTQRPAQTTRAPWTPAPTTQRPAQTTTAGGAPSGAVKPTEFCKGKADGFYKDPVDCGHFYQCSFEVAYHEPCPGGTYFSTALQGCDWAANVPTCP